MANPFSIARSHTGPDKGELTVLALDGFLDAHTAPEFESAIQSDIDTGHLQFVVDCAKLTYISSAGLGVFMGFIEELRERGGDIKICGLTPKVEQVFEIIKKIRELGKTVFVVEQNANMALSIADRGYVIQTGQVVLADTAENLMANPLMREAYLGEL